MVHCDLCEAEFPEELIDLYNSHPVCERCASDLEMERVELESRASQIEHTILSLIVSPNSLELYGKLVVSLQSELAEIVNELSTIHGVDC